MDLIPELPKGLNPPTPLLLTVGVKAGFEDATARWLFALVLEIPAEYFEPDASATFCIIPSGVKSRSERAVI